MSLRVSTSIPLSSACSGLRYMGVPDQLGETGVERLVREALLAGRLGDAEIDHLGHRGSVVERDQDVRRLEVAVDDPLLMGMLDGLADEHEQIEPVGDAQAGFRSQYSVIGMPRTSSMTK